MEKTTYHRSLIPALDTLIGDPEIVNPHSKRPAKAEQIIIPYGYLAHPIYGLFMAGSFLYFILTKSYKVLFNYMLNAKLSFWNWLFLFLGIILGTIGEEISNMQLEEMTETLFYLSFMALIYLQAHNKNYIMQTENKNE